MAVNIDVITGFLEAGKTTFIKELLQSDTLEEYENPLLLLCEEGMIEYEMELLEKSNTRIHIIESYEELNEELFTTLEREYNPDYIIVEYNGTWEITDFFSKRKPGHYNIRNVIFISDGTTFQSYLSNMTTLIQPHILNSNFVIFNRIEHLDQKEKAKLKRVVHNINKNTGVYFPIQWSEEKKIMNYFTPFETYQKISPGMIITLVILSILCFLPYKRLESIYEYVQAVSVFFISILMQAVPFVLLGAFVSSFIQLMVPASFIISRFTKNNYKSYFFAAIAGFFLPVCDCGLIPMVSGLLKKGAPLPQTMIFWLTSAAVNPVVILSVLYAFPDKPYLVLIRIAAGIIIGLLVGFLLRFGNYTTKDAINTEGILSGISGNVLKIEGSSIKERLKGVFYGAKLEFFRVFKFVIYGAFLSALLQYSFGPFIKGLFGGNFALELVIMMVAAVFMSTCATSNAFIGRSFNTNFSQASVLAFVVLGPMIDFKNLIMLSEVLKMSFLLRLVLMICFNGLLLFSLIHFLV
ncbi:permease [Anaerocolumna cellulosilytica]|uniref:Permease n=1 Tax=Anaerocolumna cellulosilytica TaxID=433286 RepID=A0A6S6RAT1_9FIRM|nr:permease [Anaerocolumna cellulosilytica]MBB5195115.1 hypothetical protein [Anaerocolumna cellulosilytica]BCJ96048.1 permease [Anaerocolumna cellulosilytica]